MPIDPQIQTMLDEAASLNLPPTNTLSAHQVRENAKLRPLDTGPQVASVENRMIPGLAGQIPVRIYQPDGTGMFPVLVWFHGGGMVTGDLDRADATSRRLCVRSGCVVVSVDYRLAPENKFPAAPDDCYSVTSWVADNGPVIQADSKRIAVGGDSAGGNLAAVVALMARDRGGPKLTHQLLIYPMMDCNFDTASYTQNADDYSLTRDTMIWFWDQYLGSQEDASNPYAVPLQAKDLKELPSALVITAEYDPLRDDGAAYASRLEAAGVATICTQYDGMIHGFFGMAGAVSKGDQAVTQASESLKKALWA